MKLKALPSYGKLMSVERFIMLVDKGYLIDYDGSGCYATDTQISDIDIHPSDGENKVRDTVERYPEFTHVMWFNR